MDPGVVGYNAMIKGYCKFGMMNDALTCVQRMKDGDHSPDEFTYSTIIDGYVKQNDLHNALKLFGQMVKQKCKPNVVTYTSLINGFCRTGDSSRAEKTFEEMRSSGLKPNVVTYTILIGCFCKEGKISKACSFFELMLLNRCIPNDVTFNYLINGLTNNVATAVSNKANESLEIKASLMMDFFRTMISDGWEQRVAAYNSVLICLCHHKMVNAALQLRDKMTGKGIFPDPVSFAALVYGLCLEGRSKEWKNTISCKLNEWELQIAVKYSQKLNQFLPKGLTSEASKVFHTLLEGVKLHIQENNLIVSARNRS